jgi:hypothetical protein
LASGCPWRALLLLERLYTLVFRAPGTAEDGRFWNEG